VTGVRRRYGAVTPVTPTCRPQIQESSSWSPLSHRSPVPDNTSGLWLVCRSADLCRFGRAEIDLVLPSSRQVSPRSTAEADGFEALVLDPALLPQALAIRDWLLTEAAQLADSGQILPGLADRLTAAGIPIDRITTAIDVLHSEYAGIGRFWTKEEGATSRRLRMAPSTIGSTARARLPTFTTRGNGCCWTSRRHPTAASALSRT
jgi:hypothetical protein